MKKLFEMIALEDIREDTTGIYDDDEGTEPKEYLDNDEEIKGMNVGFEQIAILQRLQNTISKTGNEGTLSKTSIEMFKISMESIMRFNEIPHTTGTLCLEAVSDRDVTNVCLEGIISSIKDILKAIKELAIKIWEKIIGFFKQGAVEAKKEVITATGNNKAVVDLHKHTEINAKVMLAREQNGGELPFINDNNLIIALFGMEFERGTDPSDELMMSYAKYCNTVHDTLKSLITELEMLMSGTKHQVEYFLQALTESDDGPLTTTVETINNLIKTTIDEVISTRTVPYGDNPRRAFSNTDIDLATIDFKTLKRLEPFANGGLPIFYHTLPAQGVDYPTITIVKNKLMEPDRIVDRYKLQYMELSTLSKYSEEMVKVTRDFDELVSLYNTKSGNIKKLSDDLLTNAGSIMQTLERGPLQYKESTLNLYAAFIAKNITPMLTLSGRICEILKLQATTVAVLNELCTVNKKFYKEGLAD
jgi:hypothetical protein